MAVGSSSSRFLLLLLLVAAMLRVSCGWCGCGDGRVARRAAAAHCCGARGVENTCVLLPRRARAW
jgi:hypothetical protein